MVKRILVTGGSGLVGQAIRAVINDPNVESVFRAASDEEWFFVSSKEADLRCDTSELSFQRTQMLMELQITISIVIETRRRHESCLKRFALRMSFILLLSVRASAIFPYLFSHIFIVGGLFKNMAHNVRL